MWKAVAIIFALSWLWIALFVLAGGTVDSPLFVIIASVLMWIPGTCALYLSRAEGFIIPLFKTPTKWDLLACVSALGITLVTALVSLPFKTLSPVWAYNSALLWLIMAAVVAGVTINALIAMGEELFWRGYLYEKLKHLGNLQASLRIGLLWGLWHAPVILMGYNYPTHPLLGILMMTFFTLSLSPLLYFFRQKGGAVMTPAIFHGTINASAALSLIIFEDPDPFLIGVTGFIGIIVMSFASWYVIHQDRKQETV